MNIALDQPCLATVAREMVGHTGTPAHADLSRVVVVVPGGRARRRLIELLCEHAAPLQAILSPPRVVTPRQFCEIVRQSVRQSALSSEAEQLGAWRQAVENERAVFDDLLADSDAGARHAWDFLGLARRMMSLYATLRGERLSMANVADRLAKTKDGARWHALAVVERRYEAVMAAHGIEDAYAAFEAAMATVRCGAQPLPNVDMVWSVGVVDAFGQYAAALDAVKDRLTVVTHGEPAWFDPLTGFLRKPGVARNEVTPDPIDEALHFVDTPADQARTVYEALAAEAAVRGGSSEASLAYGDIVVGVPDQDVIGPLADVFAAAAIRTHSAAGMPFRQTELGMLCAALEEYLHPVTGMSFTALMTLARHPLVAAACKAHKSAKRALPFPERLTAITEFAAEFLVTSVATPDLYRRTGSKAARGQEELASLLGILHGQDLFGPLGGTATLAEWATRFTAAFGRLCTDAVPAPADVSLAIHNEAISVWCRTTHAIAESRVPWLDALPAHVALGHLAGLCGEETIVVPANAPSVELVGWLELALDDAPVVVVTGLNDERVPESLTADMFLPDSMRALLGMPDNERRLQRDRYLLRTLVTPGRRVVLVAGRRSAMNDPLKPSRLILDADTRVRAARLKAFFKETAPADDKVVPTAAVDITPPAPARAPDNEGSASFWVTDFSIFLSCAYKYYLSRIEGIGEPDEVGGEINARGFGILVHEGLKTHGLECGDLDEHAAVTAVNDHIGRLAASQYGTPLHPAAQIQLDVARSRLGKAIEVIHAYRSTWRVATDGKGPLIERSLDFSLDVDGRTVAIKGKVDRIETNGSAFRVIDFKTGSTSVNAAVKGGSKNKNPVPDDWKDLQLPLYALWARKELCKDKGDWPQVGYFRVGRSMAEIGPELAPWPGTWFDSAREATVAVIRTVLQGGPFDRTEKTGPCANCPYKRICHR